jgi:hypothetical protein
MTMWLEWNNRAGANTGRCQHNCVSVYSFPGTETFYEAIRNLLDLGLPLEGSQAVEIMDDIVRLINPIQRAHETWVIYVC